MGTNWYDAIVDCIPRSTNIEIGGSIESNGRVVVVVVMNKGDDREKLEKEPIEIEDEMFAQIVENLLTLGVWPSLWA